MVTRWRSFRLRCRRGPPQVEVAVLQADVLRGVDLVLDGEGRRLRLGQDADLARQHLDASRGQLRVHGLGRTARHLAHHGQHVLAAHLVGGRVGVRRDLGPRHHLAEPLAVAQVDEHHPAQVAAGGRPAHEGDGFPDAASVSDPQLWVRVRVPRVSAIRLLLQVFEDAPSRARPPGRSRACRAPPTRPSAISSSPRMTTNRAPSLSASFICDLKLRPSVSTRARKPGAPQRALQQERRVPGVLGQGRAGTRRSGSRPAAAGMARARRSMPAAKPMPGTSGPRAPPPGRRSGRPPAGCSGRPGRRS